MGCIIMCDYQETWSEFPTTALTKQTELYMSEFTAGAQVSNDNWESVFNGHNFDADFHMFLNSFLWELVASFCTEPGNK